MLIQTYWIDKWRKGHLSTIITLQVVTKQILVLQVLQKKFGGPRNWTPLHLGHESSLLATRPTPWTLSSESYNFFIWKVQPFPVSKIGSLCRKKYLFGAKRSRLFLRTVLPRNSWWVAIQSMNKKMFWVLFLDAKSFRGTNTFIRNFVLKGKSDQIIIRRTDDRSLQLFAEASIHRILF